MTDYFYAWLTFRLNVRLKGFDGAYNMLRRRMGK